MAEKLLSIIDCHLKKKKKEVKNHLPHNTSIHLINLSKKPIFSFGYLAATTILTHGEI